MGRTSKLRFAPHFILGALLIAAGVLVLLDNLELVYLGSIWELWRYWPLLLILLGVGKFWEATSMKERRDGFWLIAIGVWLLVSFLEVFGLGFGETWPLLLIAAGISSVWQALSTEPRHLKSQGE